MGGWDISEASTNLPLGDIIKGIANLLLYGQDFCFHEHSRKRQLNCNEQDAGKKTTESECT